MDNSMIEPITLSIFANYLYDYLKIALPINIDNITHYFLTKKVNINHDNAEQIIDFINKEELRSKVENLDKQKFVAKLENEKLQKIIQSINNHLNQINNHNSTVHTGEGDVYNVSSEKSIGNIGGNHTHNYNVKEKDKKKF